MVTKKSKQLNENESVEFFLSEYLQTNSISSFGPNMTPPSSSVWVQNNTVLFFYLIILSVIYHFT